MGTSETSKLCRVWIEDFLQLDINCDHFPTSISKKTLIAIQEFIHKFPAMDKVLRAHAEYTMAVLLARTGQPDDAESAFTQSLNHSIQGAGSYFLHSIRKSFRAQKYNMRPDWDKALEYAEKARALADEALTEAIPFDLHIERIKNTIRLLAARAELAEKASRCRTTNS
jgi:tetratricopeptide (TPR) repeat protein